jgi:hypothetical protein
MSYEDIGRRYPGAKEQLVEVTGDSRARSWEWAGIAPAFSSPIKPTCLGELRYLSLNPGPGIARSPRTGIEDDNGRPGSRAVDVKSAAADVDGVADPRKALLVTPTLDALVDRPKDE